MKKLLHNSVADELRTMIVSGNRFETGDRLPSEPELAKECGVSRATLREALKVLEAEDLLYRKHGLGTFVKSTEPAITLSLSVPRSITAMIESLNFLPGTKSMKINTEKVFPDDVERLQLSPGAEVIRIERIRTANGQPVAYTIDVVPYWAMTKYPQWDGVSNFSLIDHLTYKCALRLEATKAMLSPLHHIKSIADKLEIDQSSHIFFFEGTDKNTDNVPVIYSREYFAPWIFRFSLTRNPIEL